MKCRLPVLAIITLLVASCTDEPAPAADDGRTASGDVLEGTINDDMLPLESVTSQPPLLREVPVEETSSEAVGAAAVPSAPRISSPGDTAPIAEEPETPPDLEGGLY